MTEKLDAIYGAAAGGGKFDPLWDDFLRMREQRNLLLEALEAHEWETHTGSGGQKCSWCKEFYPEHRLDCQREAAIALAVTKED